MNINIKNIRYLTTVFCCLLGSAHANIKDVNFYIRTVNTAIHSFCENSGNKPQFTSTKPKEHEFTSTEPQEIVSYSPNKYNWILPFYQLGNNIYDSWNRQDASSWSFALKSALPIGNIALALSSTSRKTLNSTYTILDQLKQFTYIVPLLFGANNKNDKTISWFSWGLSTLSSNLFATLKTPNDTAFDRRNPSRSTTALNLSACLVNAGIYQYFFRNRENATLKQVLCNFVLGHGVRASANYVFATIHKFNSSPAQEAAFLIEDILNKGLFLKNYDSINQDIYFDKQFECYRNKLNDDEKKTFKNSILDTKIEGNTTTLKNYLTSHQTSKSVLNNVTTAYLTYLTK